MSHARVSKAILPGKIHPILSGITHSLRICEVGIEFPPKGRSKKFLPKARSAAGRNFLTFPRVGILFPLPKSVGNDIPVLFIKIAIYVVMGIVLSQGMHFYVLMGKTIPI